MILHLPPLMWSTIHLLIYPSIPGVKYQTLASPLLWPAISCLPPLLWPANIPLSLFLLSTISCLLLVLWLVDIPLPLLLWSAIIICPHSCGWLYTSLPPLMWPTIHHLPPLMWLALKTTILKYKVNLQISFYPTW